MLEAIKFTLAFFGLVFGVPAFLWLAGKGLAAVMRVDNPRYGER